MDKLKLSKFINIKLIDTKSKLLVMFSLVFIFISGICLAQQEEIKLFVSPEIFEFNVKRGEILKENIKIYNKSELAIPIEVTVTNFGAQEESGTITFFEKPIPKESVKAGPTSIIEEDISYNPRKWIKVKNPNFILDPKEIEEVKLEINVPENAEPGGHYAVALFEPKLPSYYFEGGVVQAIPKIGVLFLFSVDVEGVERVETPLTIIEFAIPEKFHLQKLEDFFVKTVRAAEELIIVEKSHLPFILSIKNNDIYHIKPEGKLEILTSNGKIVGETKIQKTTILPGRIRKFPVEFRPDLPEKLKRYLPALISNFISRNLLFGKYRANLFLLTENSKIEKEIEFWVFPWKITLFTVCVIVFSLIFLVKYRKRIKKAILILFKK